MNALECSELLTILVAQLTNKDFHVLGSSFIKEGDGFCMSVILDHADYAREHLLTKDIDGLPVEYKFEGAVIFRV